MKSLLKENSISQTTLAEQIGYTQRAVSKWVNDQAEPTETAICLVAKYFGVSPDYLLGFVDELGVPIIDVPSSVLSADEREILALYQNLSSTKKEDLRIYLRSLSCNPETTVSKKNA